MKEIYSGRKGSPLGHLAIRMRKYRIHRRIISGGMKSKKVKYEGLNFHYYYSRNGKPPLVLLHGFLDSAQSFRRIFQKLNKHFDLYAVDVPGFGYSRMPAIRELWDIDAVARSLGRFIYFGLGLSKVALVSHSMGGLLATHIQDYFSAVYKEKLFTDLHLVAPGLLKLKEDERNDRRRVLYPQDTQSIRGMLKELYYAEIPEFAEIFMKGMLWEWSQEGYYYLAENIIENEDLHFFTAARLEALQTPITLYWGDEDRITPIEMAHSITKNVSNVKLINFQGAGHALHIEKSEEFLDAFLNEHKSLLDQNKKN